MSMTKAKGSTQLNCFSPPVMIGTMIVEVAMALYTVWRYKMDNLTRLVTITLITLATFQMAEYFVCTASIGHVLEWSRFGFAAITLLPPLGLHLMHVVAGKPGRRLVRTAYFSMVCFVAFFLLFPAVFNRYQCTGNYVIFRLRPHAGGAYWIYYFGWIITSTLLGFKWANELSKLGKKARTHLQMVQALIVGWFIFIVPTAIANIINPATRQGIPSIMCGFAVLFALILAFYISPRAAQVKSRQA
jgi:hypothetical protein